MTDIVYLAGGCLWSVQHFMKSVPGVVSTEAGRANGASDTLDGPYDGYAECVKIEYDTDVLTVHDLMEHLFMIIDPHSLNKQGEDVGEKYRTGFYSNDAIKRDEALRFINARDDRDLIRVEVKPLTNYVKSAEEHQDHLELHPEDYHLCYVPLGIMNKYRKGKSE